MKANKCTRPDAFRWKQFNRKGYAVFCSLKKEFQIGVLAFSTLTFVNMESVSAQNETPVQLKNYELEEIEVTGTRVPLTELESAKMVTVLSRADIQAAAVQSINDLLKYAVGVDVRQRGEFGVQTDISVRGGTFDQVTLLLNGVNITNPQTGHHTADLPVSLNDIERIEILEGPAARVFGTSAFTGAINIITRSDKDNQGNVHLTTGGYGLFGGGGRINYVTPAFAQQASGSYHRSDGATKNSDFRIGRAYYQGKYTSSQADIRWQFGVSDQKFGANTFYTPKYDNQYEELRRYLISVQAESKGWLRLTPTIYWQRSQDHYQLIRGDDFGENFHRNDVFGANLNAYFTSVLGKTAFGAEIRNEGILSTNLGKPLEEEQYVKVTGKDRYFDKQDNRTHISYYLEHNLLLEKWTLSLGILAHMNTALETGYRYYPGVDLSFRPKDRWKLYASWNKALRMPTFTDLYYQSETLQGNVGLRPEETQAITLGSTYRTYFFRTDVSIFYHRGKNMIDWVQYEPDDKFHSRNFKLDNMGVELNTEIRFRQIVRENFLLDNLQISYAYIYQKRHDDIAFYRSNYAFQYLKHTFIARLNHRIWRQLCGSWSLRWQNRMGGYDKYEENGSSSGILTPYPSYVLVDLKLHWDTEKIKIFAEANNLLNRTYYDFGDIPQAGFWLRAGINYTFSL